MAKTNFVKQFRGQRTCQHAARDHEGKCGKPLKEHYFRQNALGSEANVKGDPDDMVVSDHPFTQTPLQCGACSEPINIGDPYKWVAPRAYRGGRGHKMVRHQRCRAWRPSELTSSAQLSTVYGAQETAEDELSALDFPTDLADCDDFLEVLKSIADGIVEGIKEAAEMYEESAQNIEDGFGHETYQSGELKEKAEALEGWATDIESIGWEDFMEELECEDCGLPESDDDHDAPEEENYHEFEGTGELQISDWAESQQGLLSDEVGAMPL